MVRGGLPAFPAEHFLAPALDRRARYPFAGWVSDLTGVDDRLDAVERALATPGDAGLMALAALREDESAAPRSSLEPAGGVPALANMALPQRETGLEARLRARRRGHRLRSYSALAGLSETEATTLHTLLDDVTVARGARVVTRGGCSDAMYLIDRGRAEVRGPGGAAPARPR